MEPRKNSYAEILFRLWQQFFSEEKYVLKEVNGFVEAKQISFNDQKAVLIVHLAQAKKIFSKLKLQLLIKKYKAEWLIQVGNDNIVSSRFPQLIVLNNPEKITVDKRFPSAFFAVCSHVAKQKFVEHKGLPEQAVHVIPAAADRMYQPLSWSEQQAVKMQYTQGREYFIVNGRDKTSASFMLLLKAFSAFKKWQHSSMKLVVNGRFSFTKTKEWTEKMDTYKYREDILILNSINEEQQVHLLTGAYAFIHTPTEDNDVVPALQAMQCQTPCISFFTDTIHEYCNDAVILIESDNYDLVSEKMILLYKDETLRSNLIEKGKQRAQLYTQEKATAALISALPVNLH